MILLKYVSFLVTNWPSKVSFHYTILGVTLDKIQFIEALTPTYDVTHLRHTIVYQKVYTCTYFKGIISLRNLRYDACEIL